MFQQIDFLSKYLNRIYLLSECTIKTSETYQLPKIFGILNTFQQSSPFLKKQKIVAFLTIVLDSCKIAI
jgi:hypothetical protein